MGGRRHRHAGAGGRRRHDLRRHAAQQRPGDGGRAVLRHEAGRRLGVLAGRLRALGRSRRGQRRAPAGAARAGRGRLQGVHVPLGDRRVSGRRRSLALRGHADDRLARVDPAAARRECGRRRRPRRSCARARTRRAARLRRVAPARRRARGDEPGDSPRRGDRLRDPHRPRLDGPWRPDGRRGAVPAAST